MAIQTLEELADAWWTACDKERSILSGLLYARPDLHKQLSGVMNRMARSMERTKDPVWFRRAAAVADMIYRHDDARDAVVSLVLLRSAAERAGIAAREILDESVRLASEEMRPVFENARDHAPTDVDFTEREYGPLSRG